MLAFERQVRGLEGKGYTGGRHNPDLIAVIEQNPDEDGPFLVYADWLLERNDPRGTFIRLMSDRNDKTATEWREAHAEQLAPRRWAPYLSIDWHLGFIHRLTLRAQLVGGAPFVLGRALAHPSARFVREIVIDDLRYTHASMLVHWKQLLSQRCLVASVTLRNSPALEPLVGAIPGLVCAAGSR